MGRQVVQGIQMNYGHIVSTCICTARPRARASLVPASRNMAGGSSVLLTGMLVEEVVGKLHNSPDVIFVLKELQGKFHLNYFHLVPFDRQIWNRSMGQLLY